MPWTYLPNWHCFVKPARHASLVIAQSECRDDPNCGGVYKPLNFGLDKGGDGVYFLCDQRPANDGAKGDQVWGKPQGMTATKVQRQLGVARASTRHLQGSRTSQTDGCTLETGLCAWTSSGKKRWTRGGSTPSSGTGPTEAQAGKQFAFLETFRV